MGKTGRKSKYEPIFAKYVYYMALAGFTDVQMAEELEVSEATFHNWKRDHPELLESIKEAKILPDDEIEASLFQRARGYRAKATHISNYKGEITETEYIKHYPPDTAAAFIWLKNRRPERWRDKVEHDIGDTAAGKLQDLFDRVDKILKSVD